MHGIFSLTAQHLACLDPPNKRSLIAIAAQYHNMASSDFQANIHNFDDYDSDGLFASASINILYVFAAFGNLCSKDASKSLAI